MSELLDKQTNKQAIKPPQMWSVVFMNDDFTTFEFVMFCLISIFQKSGEEAYAITKAVHESGKGVVGQYPRDIAETRKETCLEYALANEYPLQINLEPVN